jgi:DNA damage-binding protein 1
MLFLTLQVAATRRNAAAASEFRTFLEATGEFYLGDMVNRFATGSLVMLPMEDAPSARPDDDDVDLLPSAGSAKRQKRTVGAETEVVAESTVVAKAKAAYTIKPRLIFGTVGGSIGAILTMNASLYKFLATVQRAINLTIPGVGGLSHATYRSWYSDRKVPNTLPIGATQPVTRGFIDGDLIETLLDVEKDVQVKVVAAMNGLRGECVVEDIEAVMHPDGSRSSEALLEEVMKVVEDLARLH